MARTPRRGAARYTRKGVAVTGVAAALLAVAGTIPGAATSASAATRQFGPAVEAYGGYEPQLTCDPTPKAGTKALADYLVRTYPGTGSLGISRRCDVGGRSEHKEGRAFDWAVDYSDPTERAQAEAFLRWLLASDAYGNEHAMARRLGIMYVIWDRQIWSASSREWHPYSGASAHRDHVHISLTWPGALGRTSFWTGQLAPGPAPAPTPAPAPAPTPAPAPGPAPARIPPLLDQTKVRDAVVPVSGTGRSVRTSFSLKAGTTYRLAATGTYRYGSGSMLADASCSWHPYDDSGWDRRAMWDDGTEDRLDLTVDGASRWRPRDGHGGGCDGSHVYVWDYTPRTTGPVVLQLRADGMVPDAGMVEVHVLRAGASVRRVRGASAPGGADAPTADVPALPSAAPLSSESLVVPAHDPAGVLTAGGLVAGAEYDVQVSGTFSDGEGEADGECSRRSQSSQWRPQVSLDPLRPRTDHLDLYLDGVDLESTPAAGGACDSAAHLYRATYQATRDGRARLVVWDPRPADNSGELRVQITRRAPSPAARRASRNLAP